MKKVWRYVANYKKLLVITILAMLMVQSLGLVAPLIVKSILDDYLVGIEKPWYETTEDKSQVEYSGSYYTQKEENNTGVSIVIYQGKYYFVEDIVVSGNKNLDENTLSITTYNEDIIQYQTQRMTTTQVLAFYQPFISSLTWMIALLAIRFLLQILFTYIQRISTSMINVNIVRDARKDAVKSLQNMPMTFFETEPSGKIANRVISDVGGMMNLFATIMNLLINASLAVIFAYIGMFYLDPKLALFTFIIFPIVYLWLKFFMKKLNIIAVKVNEQSSLITAQLNEIINGISIVVDAIRSYSF